MAIDQQADLPILEYDGDADCYYIYTNGPYTTVMRFKDELKEAYEPTQRRWDPDNSRWVVTGSIEAAEELLDEFFGGCIRR